MSLYGGCDCKNIEIVWHIADQEFVPRACQCEYWQSKSAAYVSQPNSSIEVTVRNSDCIGKYSMAQILQFFTSALIARKWFLLQQK